MDPRRTPERVGVGHRADQGTDIGRYAWPTRAAALPGPEQAEAAAVPRDDGLGPHKDESRTPVGPDAEEPHPEQAVRSGQTHARSAGALHDPKLVSQRENLQMQRCARANQRTEREEDGRDDGHHRWSLSDGGSGISMNRHV